VEPTSIEFSLSLRVADLAGIVQLTTATSLAHSEGISVSRPCLCQKYGGWPRPGHHADTREPLSQIALDCEMCDQAHLTACFASRRNNSERLATAAGLWRCRAGAVAADGVPVQTRLIATSMLLGWLWNKCKSGVWRDQGWPVSRPMPGRLMLRGPE